MKKVDILASFIIGVISAGIAMFILDFAEWEQFPLFGEYPLALFLVLPIGAIGMIFVANILVKKIPVVWQVAKCFLVGILNTFLYLGLLNLLMWHFQIFKGWHWNALNAAAFSIGAVNSYFWNKYWAFEKKETRPGAGEFGRLYVITGIGFFLNLGITYSLVNIVGPQFEFTAKIWNNLAAGIAVFIVFAWNFIGYKFVVFKK